MLILSPEGIHKKGLQSSRPTNKDLLNNHLINNYYQKPQRKGFLYSRIKTAREVPKRRGCTFLRLFFGVLFFNVAQEFFKRFACAQVGGIDMNGVLCGHQRGNFAFTVTFVAFF